MAHFIHKIQKLKNLLTQSEVLLLTCSNNPDADALGSLLAFCQGIKNHYPKKQISFCVPNIPQHLKFLPCLEEIIQANSTSFLKPDLIITFDIGDLKRMPQGLLLDQSSLKIVNIDHHKNGLPKDCLNIIKKNYPSTTEIIFEIFKKMQWKINKDIAACLLAGLIYDTASFQHSNTTPRTLETAAELMRQGANLYKISQNILNYKMPLAYLKAWGGLLRKAKKKKNGLIVSALSKNELKKLKAQKAEFSPVANLLSMVPKIKYSLILIEKEEGKVKGSLRTERGRGIDVAEIAKHFGGGGHKLAAGFTIAGKLYETPQGWKIIKL